MAQSARRHSALVRECSGTPKGRDRARQILDTAVAVFVEQGYANFTVRAVADAAGISIGNLNYYFPRKSELMRAMVEYVIEAYLAEFERLRRSRPGDPRAQLARVLEFWLEDLGSPRTTRFFPELWALANHDAGAARLMDEMYDRARQVLAALLAEIEPDRPAEEIEQRSVLLVATLEGLTLFAGHRKPWGGMRGELRRLCLVALDAAPDARHH